MNNAEFDSFAVAEREIPAGLTPPAAVDAKALDAEVASAIHAVGAR